MNNEEFIKDMNDESMKDNMKELEEFHCFLKHEIKQHKSTTQPESVAAADKNTDIGQTPVDITA